MARRDVTGRFLENGPAEHQVGNEEDNKREERIGKCCLKAVESRRCERNDDDRSYEKRGTVLTRSISFPRFVMVSSLLGRDSLSGQRSRSRHRRRCDLLGFDQDRIDIVGGGLRV